MKLLEVNNLNIHFASAAGRLPVVSEVSFYIEAGEILGLVGESGCGKSVSCLALTRLLPAPPAEISADAIRFAGRNGVAELTAVSNREMRKIRGGGIGYIFQEPSASLNPVIRVGDQIAEAVELHRTEVTDVRAEVLHLLRQVGIPDPEARIDAYPHEMSGGMQQRIMIAMALAGAPELLIADEPTTALDVTIQAQILELIDRMRQTGGMAVILVTHNLGIVSELADRVAVMYAGQIVETGRTADILADPRHPYTEALLAAVPRPNRRTDRLTTIPGNVPTPENYPSGCRFFGRCRRADACNEAERLRCANHAPANAAVSETHFCRCHFPHEGDVSA
jgi:oligopeptide/dipeptide ABC transporter ATP-binding protein